MKRGLTDKIQCTENFLAEHLFVITFVMITLFVAPLHVMAQSSNKEMAEKIKALNSLLTQNKHDELYTAAEEIKSKAVKEKNYVYYYYAWRYQIIDLRNQVKLYEALQQANSMLQQANKQKGIDKDDRQKIVFMSYEVLGKIFEARGNYTDAAIYLNKALESINDNIRQNGYELSIYNALARVYRNDEKFEQSLEFAEKGLALSKKHDPTTFKLLQSKAFALYYLGRKSDFLSTYQEMKNEYGNEENFDRLNIRKYAYDKRYDEAHKLAGKTKEERERYREHLLVYMAQQDWKAAYECEKRLGHVETARQQSLLSKDLANLSTKYDAERLRADNYELEVQNARTVSIFLVLFTILVVAGIYIMLRIEKKHVNTLSKTNRELAEARDKAEASNRMKTKFVQNISHEIRTPLNAIVGFSDLLTSPDMELSGEEKREFSNTISTNTKLLTNIVNDMLELSDLQSGDAKAEITECHCNELCKMALVSADIDKQDGVKIRFTTDVDDNFTIMTDRVRLDMVIQKFLANAKKYTSEGEIILDCSRSNLAGFVTFSVTDTGCGVPKDKRGQLFQSFEKIDNFKQGAGLGLYICSLIANLLKARIGIDPDYTSGSRFYIAVKN